MLVVRLPWCRLIVLEGLNCQLDQVTVSFRHVFLNSL